MMLEVLVLPFLACHIAFRGVRRTLGVSRPRNCTCAVPRAEQYGRSNTLQGGDRCVPSHANNFLAIKATISPVVVCGPLIIYIYKGITRLLAAYPLRGRLDVPKTDPNTGPEEQPISNATKPKNTSQGVQRRMKVPQHAIVHIAKHIERRAHTS